MSELEVRLISDRKTVEDLRDHVLAMPGVTVIERASIKPAKRFGHVILYMRVDIPDE